MIGQLRRDRNEVEMAGENDPTEGFWSGTEFGEGGAPQGEGDRLLDAALRLLSRREHSVKELQRKLRKKGFTPEEISGVIEKVQRLGYLSDERFAESRARDLIRRGYGPGYIRSDLAARGVRLEEGRMEENFGDLGREEEASARFWLEKKTKYADLGTLSPEEKFKLKRRLVGFLVRKGFSETLAFRLVNEALKNAETPGDTQ